MNLCRYLLENGKSGGAALLALDRTYTYADLWSASSSVAKFLQQRGGTKGDRVILIAENGLLWVAGYLGTLQAGMVSVPLPTTIAQSDLSSILRSVEPRCAIVDHRSFAKFLPELGGLPVICDLQRNAPVREGDTIVLSELMGANDALPNCVELDADELAALMFTSGSTGAPRGVMVSVRNIIANTNSIIEYLSLASNDRIMAVLPFHYCFGASLLHTHLRVGASVVLDSRFMYPDTVLNRMRETDCTGFAGVPSHYQILLRRSSMAKMDFPRLRQVQQAGGHLAPALVNELQHALPHTDVVVMYGQTEATARLAYLAPEYFETKHGSVGKAIPGVQLLVVDDGGRPVAPGQIGEVVARGDNITQGYWKDAAQTAKVFKSGCLYTGDLAVVDDDGFIFLVDRARDFLKCRGQRVSCRSLEDKLLQCGSLLEAAVIGIPDPVLGEAVKAFVVPCNLNQPSLADQVMEYCRRSFPLAFVPKEIVVLKSLPKNSSGKILKAALRGKTAVATV